MQGKSRIVGIGNESVSDLLHVHYDLHVNIRTEPWNHCNFDWCSPQGDSHL